MYLALDEKEKEEKQFTEYFPLIENVLRRAVPEES